MLDVLLFAAYTIGSVTSLVLIKIWLAPALAAWRTGGDFALSGLMVALGGGLYVVSFLTWMAILARNELSAAYPVAVGLTLLFSAISAASLLGESISLIRGAGMLLIVLGVALVARS
jgi:multidrug transporter EmrE-like cation transporter